MKAGELASWLLTQQEDLEVCIYDTETEDWIPMERPQMQLRKIVNVPDE